MSEFEEDIKKVIKEDGWRDVEFLWKRIMERMGGSYEDAKRILDRIVAEDRSLRYIKVHSGHDRIGMVLPPGTPIPKRRVWISYHSYLEENSVYRGRRRGRPRRRR